MPYVGNKPEVGNFRKCDAITTSATATYNLLVGGVAVNPNQNQCIVSLNGVIQSSGNSYTIASSQITFASALTSSDVIDFILILGDTLDVGTVSDDTIGLAQLSATGSPSSSNYLRGDNSWQTVSGTTINNNADNRVITGSGTANTLEGEANVTYANPKLMVANSGDSTFEIQSGNSDQCRLNFGDTDSSTIGQIRYTHSDNSMKIEVNGAERLRIKDDGKVLIGTASELHTQGILQVKGVANHNLARFQVGSDLEGIIFLNASGNTSGSIQIGSSATTYHTSSDYRLKENETPIVDGIERLKQLKPYRFNFKVEKDKTVDGFFAHEVSSIVPEAIGGIKDETETYTDKDGNEQTRIKPQGIDQSKLVPLLTGALQEAITKIETLETKVEALENK